MPPNTLEQVPPPHPSLSPPLRCPPLTSLPLEVDPLIAARGSGEHFSSPSGSGQSPAAKRYLVNFRLKISPLVATIFSFLGKLAGECVNNYCTSRLSFCKNASPYFFHGAFAPSFTWSRRPCKQQL